MIEDTKATGRIIGLRKMPFETKSEKRIKETNNPAVMCVFRPDKMSPCLLAYSVVLFLYYNIIFIIISIFWYAWTIISHLINLYKH